MINALAFLYGLHIAALIYLMTYLSARGIMGRGAVSFFIIVVKYLIYWKVITFGFKHLPGWGIPAGMTAGIYLSLPVLYWINLKMVTSKTAGSEN